MKEELSAAVRMAVDGESGGAARMEGERPRFQPQASSTCPECDRLRAGMLTTTSTHQYIAARRLRKSLRK